MREIRYFILSLVILGSLFFLFGPEVLPENAQFEELLNSALESDIVIIFNSGGWGNTPLEKAEDFAPIIEGIEKTLRDFGYNSLVIPYNRTKNNLFGKITRARDFLNSFQTSSEIFSMVSSTKAPPAESPVIIIFLSGNFSVKNSIFSARVSEEVRKEFKKSLAPVIFPNKLFFVLL